MRTCYIPPTHQPVARPAFSCEARGDLGFGDPIAGHRLEIWIGFLGDGDVTGLTIGFVGRPAMVKLVNHFSFVKRYVAICRARRTGAEVEDRTVPSAAETGRVLSLGTQRRPVGPPALEPGLSSSVPTPNRFEAIGLRYRFLAIDPNDLGRCSAVKDWTARLRLKYQIHDLGDHYEVELLALPKANGIAVRYTTDGSSPTGPGHATYDGKFRVPANARVICAMAVCPEYELNSETIRIPVPKRGEDSRPLIDLAKPARWNQQAKLDDPGAVWDIIQRLEKAPGVRAFDIGLTAESSDGEQNIDYSGSIQGGYDAVALKTLAEKLQEVVSDGRLRMTIGSLGFSTGQGLLDWLKSTNQQFNPAKVGQ